MFVCVFVCVCTSMWVCFSVCVSVCTFGKLTPLECPLLGLQGWTCVYWSVLAARAGHTGQNNGTTLECGSAGNILSPESKTRQFGEGRGKL
jgi:hypothetical protein